MMCLGWEAVTANKYNIHVFFWLKRLSQQQPCVEMMVYPASEDSRPNLSSTSLHQPINSECWEISHQSVFIVTGLRSGQHPNKWRMHHISLRRPSDAVSCTSGSLAKTIPITTTTTKTALVAMSHGIKNKNKLKLQYTNIEMYIVQSHLPLLGKILSSKFSDFSTNQRNLEFSVRAKSSPTEFACSSCTHIFQIFQESYDYRKITQFIKIISKIYMYRKFIIKYYSKNYNIFFAYNIM